MDLDHLDEQMKNSKGQFLLRLNQEDFDAKEFSFYRSQIKSKNISINPAEEKSVNLQTMIRDEIIAKNKVKLEESKLMRDKLRMQKIDTSRNGMSDTSMYAKEPAVAGNIGDLVARAMERNPEVFKTSYISQHRKKLRKNSFLFNDDTQDNQYMTGYPEKVKSMSRGYLTNRTKSFITTSLERAKGKLKQLEQQPQTVCQARHPQLVRKRMAPHEPAYISSAVNLCKSLRRPRVDKQKAKISLAVMSWLSSKGEQP